MIRYLLPLALVLALAGYFGAWVNHPVAGLVITGLDFGEYVKFIPAVRDGAISLWRVGFYAPLVAISTAALLAAYRIDFGFQWWIRFPILAIAIIAALNLVPPAWTPSLLIGPEFRLQTTLLLLLLLGVAFSPFLALLSRTIAATIVTILSLLGIAAPVFGFFQVLTAIASLYNHPLGAAWGLWTMILGLILVIYTYRRLPRTD